MTQPVTMGGKIFFSFLNRNEPDQGFCQTTNDKRSQQRGHAESGSHSNTGNDKGEVNAHGDRQLCTYFTNTQALDNRRNT